VTATPEALARVIQVDVEGVLRTHLSAYGSETDYGVEALCGRWYKAADVVSEHGAVADVACQDCLGALPPLR
jgi:hypothetical protein